MDDKSVARLLGQLVAYELSYGVDDIVATLRSIKGAINAKTVNLNIDSLFAAVFDNAEKEYAELLSDLKVKSVFTQSRARQILHPEREI